MAPTLVYWEQEEGEARDWEVSCDYKRLAKLEKTFWRVLPKPSPLSRLLRSGLYNPAVQHQEMLPLKAAFVQGNICAPFAL